MKKYLIAVLLFIPILNFAQTGNSKDKQLFVGYISAGINGSQIGGDLMAGYKKLGANIGIGTYIMYTERFSNSIEISYSMKGSQTSYSNKSPDFFKRYTLDYVEIPFQFNYHDKKIAIIHGGFSMARLIRSKTQGGVNQFGELIYRSWDMGFVAGVTFRIKERFGLNIKATLGLMNVLKGNSGYRVDATNSTNFELHNVTDGAYSIEANVGGPSGERTNASKSRNGGWYHNTVSIRFSYLFVPKSK
ncbi:MAG: outer membrane beta-barrel protein [Chitinophagales bacterium]